MRKTQQNQPWTDETIMPWGVHKGLKLKDIEADYFLWLMEQHWLPKWPGLHAYVIKNADLFYKERADEADDDEGDFRNYQDFLNNR